MALMARQGRRIESGTKVIVKVPFKKNDIVKVISGRDAGKQGRVLSVDREKGTLLVEHAMMVKRHTRPNPARGIKGGIAEREGPIQASNVMLVCPGCNKAVRVSHTVETVGGKTRRTRVCRKCGASLEKKA